MLSFNEKIVIFNHILAQKEKSYADSFNADIDLCGENYDYAFLQPLQTKESIEYWIQKLKSRIVMKEDEALLEDIIDDYVELG